MKENVLMFGNGLMGVLTTPERPDLLRPLVLIPNTGIEHRVGPNRLHVRIARALGEAGYASARIDLSGLGDSPAALDSNSTDELRAAMDELQRRGAARQFVAVGLCSGAHDAHRLTLADERVVGAAFLDGYAYKTARFAAIYAAQRLGDPARLLGFLQRLGRKPAETDIDVQRVDYYRQPGLDEFRRDLGVFMQRNLALCFVYSGQMQYVYNYASQLTDRCPELRGYPRFELHHMAHADHTFSTLAMGAQLSERLLVWLRNSVAMSATAAPATLPDEAIAA